MNRKIQSLLALLVVASVVLAACGPAAAPEPTEAQATTEESAAPDAPAEDPMAQFSPLNVSGDIITAGSSTVFPVTERMAERFRDEGFSSNITVDSIGSGAGLERFCVAGETDIANASRPINEDEVASCESIDRTPVEFRVGTDALAIVVNPANDWATDITLAELALLFTTAETWADVRPEWPAERVLRFSPGTDSGTFDYFVEEVLDDDATGLQASDETQFSEDDNVLAQGVIGNPGAIGYFGYAYYNENVGALKILNIEGVEPTEVTAEDGSYPLARPLFIYSDPTIMTSKPQVAAFIHFYLSFVNEEIIDVGYFPASEAAFDANWENFYNALGLENPM
jgi:phosphate transport system substrate-binding protein